MRIVIFGLSVSVGRRARAQVIEAHSATRRAAELITLLEASAPGAIGAWS